MSARETSVSAVITTKNRPHEVLQAVESALSQTHQEIEVVVVLDGPQSDTAEALETVADSRLRVCALPEPVGRAEALNVGAREARGPMDRLPRR